MIRSVSASVILYLFIKLERLQYSYPIICHIFDNADILFAKTYTRYLLNVEIKYQYLSNSLK